MTDSSLPQPSASNSYVDSYKPPVTGGVTPIGTSTPPPAPTSTPVSTPAAGDPLAELEKALQEYEAKQKQMAAKDQSAVKQAQAVPSDSKQDPLAELERVLDEYDRKYKQKPSAQSTPAQVPEPKTDDKTMTMDEFKYMLKNPNPPTDAAPISSAEPVRSAAPVNQEKQAIEEQNIFELLGVMDADEAEKEAFLDELQQALWEDFLDKDLSLLVNADQLKEVQALRSQPGVAESARQEQLIQKVEQLVPDVEEIMLEKALELKEDMVKERLAGMKEYYAPKPNEMTKIQEAEQHILAGRWKTGAQLLNTLTA